MSEWMNESAFMPICAHNYIGWTGPEEPPEDGATTLSKFEI